MESEEPSLPDVRCIVWLDEWLGTPLIEHSANFETEPYTKSSDDTCANRFCGAESACA